jgi:hypothetical protein
MILADTSHFTREHYEAHKGSAPSHLCELVVHCLELVSQLAHHGLSFRFKGGNSLLVLLEDPQRFSIDVDIVTSAGKEQLIALVERIVSSCELFTRYEVRQPKTKPWLPMISFKLFFGSHYQKEEDAFVMLDAVLEEAPYPGVHKPVRCASIYRSEQRVEVPSVSGLIGDKLLTIGPATLGIPLGKGKEAHRLKHVFDVSLLSTQGWDAAAVRASIEGCMAQENRIQQRSCAWNEIAADTLRFLDEPLAHETRPDLGSVAESGYLYETVKGFDAFKGHLFRVDYTWDLFRADCRKVRDLVSGLSRRLPGSL